MSTAQPLRWAVAVSAEMCTHHTHDVWPPPSRLLPCPHGDQAPGRAPRATLRL